MQTEVRAAFSPSTNKTPRSSKDPGSIMDMVMEWSKSNSDTEGAWTWGARQWSDEHWNDYILTNLQEFEKLTWSEILAHQTGGKKRHKKHHDMDVDILCDEAIDRWLDLGDGGYGDTTFRFRMGNKKRLWGYRQLNKFFVVWWDPGHNIYPTDT